MTMITLYHLSPSRYRQSILYEGLRRTRLVMHRLVLYAATLDKAKAMQDYIAEIHDTYEEYLDLWQLTVSASKCYHWNDDIWRVTVDVDSEHVALIAAGKIEG